LPTSSDSGTRIGVRTARAEFGLGIGRSPRAGGDTITVLR